MATETPMIGIIYHEAPNDPKLYLVEPSSAFHEDAKKFNGFYGNWSTFNSDKDEEDFNAFINYLTALKEVPFPAVTPIQELYLVGFVV